MRLPDLMDESLTDGQRDICHEAVAGKRGHVPGPLRAWIHSEAMARHATRLGGFLRYDTLLPQRLSELAILVTASHWVAQYVWDAHKPLGLQAGLDPAIVADLAGRRSPTFAKTDEELVYRVAKALYDNKTVPDRLYGEAQAMFGDQALVELIGLLGYYTMVAMTVNLFDFDLKPVENRDWLQR
jgi:4-carboxymuconolactone decarboxylase